jgi:NTE family protein
VSKKITLALGGGGFRGIAHIGVLQALLELDLDIRAVAGTSAGGIVGALFAAGYSPEQMILALRQLDSRKIFRRQKGETPSFLGLQGIYATLRELIGDRDFSDLKIPFACTAVDLNTCNEIVIENGKVLDAIMATIAVPGVFPFKQIGDLKLVDGGVLDPVPVNVARHLAPRLPVVAVCLQPVPEEWSGVPPFQFPSVSSVPKPILNQVERLRISQAFRIFMTSIDISSKMLSELRLAVEKPDVILRPDVAGYGLLEMPDLDVLIKAGEDAGRNAYPEIANKLKLLPSIRRLRKHSTNPTVPSREI